MATDPEALAASHYRLIYWVLKKWFPHWLNGCGEPSLWAGRLDPVEYCWRELLAAARSYREGAGMTFTSWAILRLRLRMRGQFCTDWKRWRKAERQAGEMGAARRAEAPPPSLGIDLAAAVEALDPADRELFDAWAAEDYSAADLARRRGVPLRTMQERVKRVRVKLRANLTGYDS